MVLQSSQGFLPLRALSQNILFFPYSLCFNFSLTSFKVLKLGAKWATLSSECELRAAAYYKDNPKHPRFKKSVKHNAVIFKVCYKPTPYSNTNFFLPTKFSLKILLVIVKNTFPFFICSSMGLINSTPFCKYQF